MYTVYRAGFQILSPSAPRSHCVRPERKAASAKERLCKRASWLFTRQSKCHRKRNLFFQVRQRYESCCWNGSIETWYEQLSSINTKVLGYSPGRKCVLRLTRVCALAGWASFCDAGGDGRFGKLKRVVAVGRGASKFEVKQALRCLCGSFILNFGMPPVRSILRFCWCWV